MRAAHLLVMAKSPQPGKVKTRLCPPLEAREAAELAEAALADTLEAVAGCGAERRVLALDGPVGAWLPEGFDVIPQRGSTFADRLTAAWQQAAGPGVQIGMDTPQVTSELLDACLDETLRESGNQSNRAPIAALGPAEDGGWWALGLSRGWDAPLFQGVPMSTSHTGAAQRERLVALGFSVRLLPTLVDFDGIDEARIVAATIPRSRFAAALRQVDGHLTR